MCGIAGIISLNGEKVDDLSNRLDIMLNHLWHRGPDGQGKFVSEDGLVGFANTRLSIVDPHNPFKIPMTDPKTGDVLTYNGEVFNHRELRDEHKSAGEEFETHSDTEVLLKGLSRQGISYLEKLDGFWGIAFYKKAEGKVYLSRDLLGEKHLFFYQSQDELIFSSEVNPILSVVKEDLEIDFTNAIKSFRYRASAPGTTLIKGVQKLIAGEGLVVDTQNKCVENKRFMKLNIEQWFEFFDKNPSEEEVQAVFEEHLKQACQSRVPDEVDFMSTLSGGIDSGLINVFASGFGEKKMKTLYALSTDEPPQRGKDLDEREASRFTSSKIHSDHHEFLMNATDSLPLYDYYAENSFDGMFCEGVINFGQLGLEVIRDKGKVLILSEGPDEFMGGYDVDNWLMRVDAKARPKWLLKKLSKNPKTAAFISKLSGSEWSKHLHNWSFYDKAPFIFRPVHGGTRTEVMTTLFGEESLESSFGGFGEIPECYNSILDRLDPGQKMALSYASYTIPDYFNLRNDKGVMSVSIEGRFPFLTRKLVELMIATPDKFRFKNGESSKYLLRKIMDKYIGPEIAYRQKYGFARPVWYTDGLGEKLKMEEFLNKSDIFKAYPFAPEAKAYLTDPKQWREKWFAYCLAKTHDRLKNKDFKLDYQKLGRDQA